MFAFFNFLNDKILLKSSCQTSQCLMGDKNYGKGNTNELIDIMKRHTATLQLSQKNNLRKNSAQLSISYHTWL